MQDFPPKVIRQRAQRYQRLLNMITSYRPSNQQIRMLQKIKSDTVFEISLRYKRCETNKTYKFPFKPIQSESQQQLHIELKNDKDFHYNLHSQNNKSIRDQYSKLDIASLENTLLFKNKTQVIPNFQRVSSLSRNASKNNTKRIGRIEKTRQPSKKNKLKTERIQTELSQQHQSSLKDQRQPQFFKMPIIEKSAINSQQTTFDNTQAKIMKSSGKSGNIKERNIIKSSDSKIKNKMKTEEQETAKKLGKQKLLTEETQTIKKQKLTSFLTSETKKGDKTNLLNLIFSSNSKIKPKTLFYKQIF